MCARPPGQECILAAIGARNVFLFSMCLMTFLPHTEGPASAGNYFTVFVAWASAMVHFAAEFDLAECARFDIDSSAGAIMVNDALSRLRDALLGEGERLTAGLTN